MYISKLKLHNFKGFKGDHKFEFDCGINFLVGDNNCGKSTVFYAINFLREGKSEDGFITKNVDDDLKDNEYVSVEIELCGESLSELVKQEHLKKYQNYIIRDADDGLPRLRIMRSSQETKVIQAKKEKILSLKQVRVFNPQTGQFENPSGIDSTLSALFDAQFVWADTNSNDVLDFSKTKVCGKIIERVVLSRIKDSWAEFKVSHESIFEKIVKELEPIKLVIQNKLSEQYEEAEVNFHFTLPQISDFLKSGDIELTDSGIQTSSAEKGTGMQRSLALALIQVYAELMSNEDTKISKPIFFFIDEPETFLHPKAQSKLLKSFETLSQDSQIFITTHSPYLLKSYKRETHSLWLFSKISGYNKATVGEELDLFGDSSPSWGEINYYAYGIPSVEFHNELYGFIQARAIMEDERNYYEDKFDKYLSEKSEVLQQNKQYTRLNKDNSTQEYQVTVPTYIRNIIHHPENTQNAMFSEDELAGSIAALIQILKPNKASIY